MLDGIGQRQQESITHERNTALLCYPIDMSSFLAAMPIDVADRGEAPDCDEPIAIVRFALACCNLYCLTHHETERTLFLRQARWLVEHETQIGKGFSSWPTRLPHDEVATRGSYLSALTQGCAVSVLTRAYQLTGEDCFLEVARRAVQTFMEDILDGGVSAPFGSSGVFFEEVAVYPATHRFDGDIYALLGLYDYLVLMPEAETVVDLVRRGLRTLRSSLVEFDTGFWTYTDLVHRRLTTRTQLARQVHLLEILAQRSGDEFYGAVAARWQTYQRRWGSRARYFMTRSVARCRRGLIGTIRKALTPPSPDMPPVQVCIPLNSLATGGILSVLRGVRQVTHGIWRTEYVARHVDLDEEGYVIHTFGTAMMSPWQFPTVWIYIWDGFRKLLSLMRQTADYHILLPQDGLYTGVFAGLAARLTGARTVCIDHGSLTVIDSDLYREERMRALRLKALPRRFISGVLLWAYWPSVERIARIAARVVDHFFVPGVVGDGVEDICTALGIPASRLTRFKSMIDVDKHVLLAEAEQVVERGKWGIPAEAVVVAIICRLSPEKGLEIALEAIRQALAALDPDSRARLRVVVAGDGPCRHALERDVERMNLSETCIFLGHIAAHDVIRLLAVSQIFLYTSTRGACIPMAVLEAMASECAVIATTQPLANAVLLDEGRGLIVPPGDVQETAAALARLIRDPIYSRKTGKAAREYVAAQHSPKMFRRSLQRVTHWSDLDALLTGNS